MFHYRIIIAHAQCSDRLVRSRMLAFQAYVEESQRPGFKNLDGRKFCQMVGNPGRSIRNATVV